MPIVSFESSRPQCRTGCAILEPDIDSRIVPVVAQNPSHDQPWCGAPGLFPDPPGLNLAVTERVGDFAGDSSRQRTSLCRIAQSFERMDGDATRIGLIRDPGLTDPDHRTHEDQACKRSRCCQSTEPETTI